MDEPGVLDGLTVIDLTRVLAGPYTTMVLADLGAYVIKVETPHGGDDARGFGPFLNGKSAYFSSLNRGKKSIALDLKKDSDREIFEELLAKADILVENYRAGTMDKLGYGWDKIQQFNAGIIYTAVSGFGHTGPYRNRPAYDMVVQGMGGIMSVTGEPDAAPIRVGTSVGDITAGLFGLSGLLAALYRRERTGKGAKVDVSMLDCQVAILENAIARYFSTGEIPGPLGARHPSITPFEAFKSKTDFIIIAAGNNSLFKKLCDALGRSDLRDDPAFSSNDLRTTNQGKLQSQLQHTFQQQTSTYWLEVLEGAGVPCGPINNVQQVTIDPQIRERNMIIKTDDPVSGEVAMAGNPIKISGLTDPLTRNAAPELDADRVEVLKHIRG
jgi:CoA:oxalate CoA-transferase